MAPLLTFEGRRPVVLTILSEPLFRRAESLLEGIATVEQTSVRALSTHRALDHVHALLIDPTEIPLDAVVACAECVATMHTHLVYYARSTRQVYVRLIEIARLVRSADIVLTAVDDEIAVLRRHIFAARTGTVVGRVFGTVATRLAQLPEPARFSVVDVFSGQTSIGLANFYRSCDAPARTVRFQLAAAGFKSPRRMAQAAEVARTIDSLRNAGVPARYPNRSRLRRRSGRWHEIQGSANPVPIESTSPAWRIWQSALANREGWRGDLEAAAELVSQMYVFRAP